MSSHWWLQKRIFFFFFIFKILHIHKRIYWMSERTLFSILVSSFSRYTKKKVFWIFCFDFVFLHASDPTTTKKEKKNPLGTLNNMKNIFSFDLVYLCVHNSFFSNFLLLIFWICLLLLWFCACYCTNLAANKYFPIYLFLMRFFFLPFFLFDMAIRMCMLMKMENKDGKRLKDESFFLISIIIILDTFIVFLSILKIYSSLWLLFRCVFVSII